MPLRSILRTLFPPREPAGPAAPPPTTGAPWEAPADLAARREAARWAYRTILLREPESLEALDHLAGYPSARAMREILVRSAEVRAQAGFPLIFGLNGWEPRQDVQVDVDDATRDRLFARVQRTWQRLGEQQPHWSVITNEQFRPDKLDARALEEFFATAQPNIDMMFATLRRNGIEPASLGTCIDFGCGVGRLSVVLSRTFREVHAVDVSAPHLALAREAFETRGVRNATTHHLQSIAQASQLPPVGLVYSIIVLQHNPPPVMDALLRALLGRLEPGGAAVIQVPTYLPNNYRFDAAEYLAVETEHMEMHALPQWAVFRAARAAGVEVLEVMDDDWTGFGVGSRSNTFVLRRPA